MSNKNVNELYASNKQLQVRINNISKKIETDNKEMLTLLKNINTSLKTLLLQNNKITEKINNLDNDEETKNKFTSNNLNINNKLYELKKK